MEYNIVDSMFELIRHLDFKNRLALIARISNSMLTDEKEKEQLFLNCFGAWKGEETAEEIIANIHQSSQFGERTIEL